MIVVFPGHTHVLLDLELCICLTIPGSQNKTKSVTPKTITLNEVNLTGEKALVSVYYCDDGRLSLGYVSRI